MATVYALSYDSQRSICLGCLSAVLQRLSWTEETIITEGRFRYKHCASRHLLHVRVHTTTCGYITNDAIVDVFLKV